MPNTSDPRQFYRVSRAMLMPSLWQEAFGRVPVEAAINGIPTLASNRGGLPEALGGAGFLFDIPVQYTPECRQAPTADEVGPWLQVIERLWDDEAFYRQQSERCRAAAEVWRPERLLPRFEEFSAKSIRHSPDRQANSASASALNHARRSQSSGRHFGSLAADVAVAASKTNERKAGTVPRRSILNRRIPSS